MNIKTILITFVATCIFCWLLTGLFNSNQEKECDDRTDDALQTGIAYGKRSVPKYINLPEEISVANIGDTLIGKVVDDTLYYEFYNNCPSQWDEAYSIILKTVYQMNPQDRSIMSF